VKRAVLAATVAALAILPVGLAAPAHASNDVHIRVDPRDWTWNGTVSVSSVSCNNRGCYNPAEVKTQDFAVGPNAGLQGILDWTWGASDTYLVRMGDSTLTSGDMTWYPRQIYIQVTDPLVGEMNASRGPSDSGLVGTQYDFGKPGGEYELKFYPGLWVAQAQPLWDALTQTPTNAASVTVSPADAADAAARAKNTGYVTDQPGRVTAMAKRFVVAPGDVINIHGYGPDRLVALERADHVRDHLLSEISRLGGDPDTYPVMVTYAGDPAHKRGVHVTIHQHSAVPGSAFEGAPRAVGGRS